MSLFLNVVRQENRNARFKAGAEQGVDAKRITSSCERCFLSVGMVLMRSRKSHSGSPLSYGYDRLCGLKHGKLPFGFLLRTSAIQTSLIALGLSSGDQ